MRIYGITPYKINNYQNNNIIKKQPQQNASNPSAGILPTTAQYLAFTGGYSLDLAQTVKQLDKLAQKNSSIYPPNIREWLGLVLEEGNKAKETLIGVHKRYFASLDECETLNEIKKKFPEFKDVISSENVETLNGSLIDKFRKGELEYFDNDEDLSVQLIKLYWGKGFSTNDLKQYADGKDLYHTMSKLKIPKASRDYAHILKISDPEYNERLTGEMSKKRLATLDRKAQMQEGEPVYIKRGPLSPEHKQRISEGLKKYYEENPERLYEMSERQKNFYLENPEKAKILSRVASKAWSIFGADRIKSALSKFMKGKGFKDFTPDELENPISLSKQKSIALRQFWGANEWARKSFSKNMKYAWKKVMEENKIFYTLKTSPSQVIEFVEKKAGLEPGKLNIDTRYNPYTMESSINEEAQAIVRKYTDIPGLGDVMADAYQLAPFNVVSALKDMKMTGKDKPYRDLLNIAILIIKSNTKDKGYKVQYTEEAQQDFIALARIAAESKCQGAVDIVNKALDDAFDLSLSTHKDVILK